jgi:hypothetical protein
MPDPTHVLHLHQAVALDGGASLEVEQVVIESIEAGPDDPGAYPAGSGIDVTVVVRQDGNEHRVTLTRLEGYVSQPTRWVDPFRITLLDVASPHRDPQVSLLVQRPLSPLPADAPAHSVRLVKGGPDVDIDADTRLRLVEHGHKIGMDASPSPLIVAVQWLVSGFDPEPQGVNLGPAPAPLRWRWRDLDLTVTDYAYDEWMELSVRRHPLQRVTSPASP